MWSVLSVLFTVFFLSACAHLIDAKEKPQRYEEALVGEHAVLASCVFNKLQLDSRSFMRILQFRNRRYSDIDASEIVALDTRYLRNTVATYAPTNPDAVPTYAGMATETLSYAHRNTDNESVYAFALMLKKIDDTTVNATLKGDRYFSDIAWKILQACVTSTVNP